MTRTKAKPTAPENRPTSGTTEWIVWRSISELRAYERNSRTHSPEQIMRLRQSFREFGWMTPVLTQSDGTIVAGHARIEAAKLEGWDVAKCLDVTGLSADQVRGYVIADNRLALDAGWDEEMLKLEFADLEANGFDTTMLGFSQQELDGIFNTSPGPAHDEDDDAPPPPVDPTSAMGDIWLLGRHRVMCGNSIVRAEVDILLDGARPDIANCDPPYGISVVKGSSIGGGKPFGSKQATAKGRVKGIGRAGNLSGKSKNAIIQTGVYAPIIGDDTTETAVLTARLLNDIGVQIVVLWGGNYFANELPPSRCWLIWDKQNTGTFADAELAWTNQDKVVKLFAHQWSGLIKASERGERRVHPTQKPIALARWVHATMAPKAASVIDLFLGSASTLMAAESEGLICYGMEMSPAYVDVAVMRWEKATGKRATHAETGETFDQVRVRRDGVD